MALDLSDLKTRCNVTISADDMLLARMLVAAEKHTEAQLGFALDDETEFPDGTPEDVEQAVLMLAAWWYEQRESALVGVTAQTVPHGYEDIIRNHRNCTYG